MAVRRHSEADRRQRTFAGCGLGSWTWNCQRSGAEQAMKLRAIVTYLPHPHPIRGKYSLNPLWKETKKSSPKGEQNKSTFEDFWKV